MRRTPDTAIPSRRIAEVAAIRVCNARRHRHFDDLTQAAWVALWRHGPDGEALLCTVAYRAAIDEWRRLCGRPSTPGRQLTRNAELFDDIRPMDRPTPEPTTSVSDLYKLDGRLATIAEVLAIGETKDEAARILGVSPGRVSQLLHDVRRHVTP